MASTVFKGPLTFTDSEVILLKGLKQLAALSKDDKAKIAAFAIKDNRVVSLGINGYPAGYNDSDTSHKHDKIVHAELNAIFNYGGNPKDIDTMVIYGLPPCVDCIKAMAAIGVTKVVFAVNNSIRSKDEWLDIFKTVKAYHPNINFKHYNGELND